MKSDKFKLGSGYILSKKAQSKLDKFSYTDKIIELCDDENID